MELCLIKDWKYENLMRRQGYRAPEGTYGKLD